MQTNIVQFLSELTIQDKEGSRRSVTLLAIAHSLSFFDYFDNMMVVGNGTVMEFGPKVLASLLFPCCWSCQEVVWRRIRLDPNCCVCLGCTHRVFSCARKCPCSLVGLRRREL